MRSRVRKPRRDGLSPLGKARGTVWARSGPAHQHRFTLTSKGWLALLAGLHVEQGRAGCSAGAPNHSGQLSFPDRGSRLEWPTAWQHGSGRQPAQMRCLSEIAFFSFVSLPSSFAKRNTQVSQPRHFHRLTAVSASQRSRRPCVRSADAVVVSPQAACSCTIFSPQLYVLYIHTYTANPPPDPRGDM